MFSCRALPSKLQRSIIYWTNNKNVHNETLLLVLIRVLTALAAVCIVNRSLNFVLENGLRSIAASRFTPILTLDSLLGFSKTSPYSMRLVYIPGTRDYDRLPRPYGGSAILGI